MFNLIMRDIRVVFSKRNILTTLVSVFLLSLVFAKTKGTDFIPIIFFVIALTFISTSFIYDDMSKVEIIMNSLPITRRDFVKSRYVGVIIFLVLALISSFAVIQLLGVLNLMEVSMNPLELIDLRTFVIILGIPIIVSSVMFPLFFKLGYKKAKIIWIMSFVLIFIFFSNKALIDAILTKLVISESILYTVIPAILLAMLCISYIISARIYSNKNF
ncbi:ABC-2 transporter permease [Clostridiaceae bacterium M8S5]|nr:ABC-2 transporter permease [Clostridiaceae bacterium M8S5]